MSSWSAGIAPAQAAVECSDALHRLRWDAGTFQALDHDDPDGERALAALGGQRCTCIDLLDAWDRHADDVRVLVLGPRGRHDALVEQVDPQSQARLRPVGSRSAPRAMPMTAARSISRVSLASYGPGRATPGRRASAATRSEDELAALLGLGGAVPDRLAATVAATWRGRLEQRDRSVARVRRTLQVALYGRVLATMRTWLGPIGLPPLDLTMIAPRRRPSLSLVDGVVHAALPFGWLVDVWARDLTTIGGRFTLSATSDDGRTWSLASIAPDFGAPSRVVLTLD